MVGAGPLALGLSLALTVTAVAQPAFQRRLQATERWYHALATDQNRSRVVLFGGQDGTRLLADTWEWDGTTWSQQMPPTSPAARYGHAMAYDPVRGEVVLFGGDAGSVAGDTWTYNGVTWQQRSPATSPPARVHATMAFDYGRGRIVLHGGEDASGIPLGDTWTWSGSTWTSLNTGSPALTRAAMEFDLVSQKVLLFGGRGPGGAPSPVTWLLGATGWVQQNPVASPTATWDFDLALDPARRRVVLFGGVSYSNQTWEWDGRTWVRQTPAPAPGGRERHALAYDAVSGEVVLFSGWAGGPWRDTWAWNGTAWRQRQPIPGLLWDGAVAHDPQSGITLLHGGRSVSGAGVDRTWAWDGHSWTDVTPANPFVRYGQTMTYSAAVPGLVLFGGWDVAPRNTTHLWSGGQWMAQAPAQSPPARAWHAACADGNGDVVVFGGYDGSAQRAGTWRFSGGGWNRVMASGPSARQDAAMAFDGTGVVLFGGDGGGTALNDTWRLVAGTWQKLSPATQPSPRAGHRMVHDAVRGRVFLFGGVDQANNYYGDLWSWDGSNWTMCANLPVTACWRPYFAAEQARGSLLIFGGNGPGRLLDDTFTALPYAGGSVATLGTSCAAGGAAPALTSTSSSSCPGGAFPTVGHDWTLQAQGLPASGLPMVAFVLGGAAPPSPIPLCAGQPSCTIEVSPTGAIVLSTFRFGSSANLALPVPRAQFLVGLSLYAQVFGVAASGSCLGGVYATNGLAGTIGSE